MRYGGGMSGLPPKIRRGGEAQQLNQFAEPLRKTTDRIYSYWKRTFCRLKRMKVKTRRYFNKLG